MFAAIFGIGMLVCAAALMIWVADHIEQYMQNDNICEEFTVFEA